MTEAARMSIAYLQAPKRPGGGMYADQIEERSIGDTLDGWIQRRRMGEKAFNKGIE
jgi:hypothetical protein